MLENSNTVIKLEATKGNNTEAYKTKTESARILTFYTSGNHNSKTKGKRPPD